MKTGIQLLLYLAAGGWNTIFGLGLYWLAYRMFGERVHYMVIAVAVNVLAITNAFLCYKFFVFRTKGNWLPEYMKCWIVYGGGTLVSMVLLWLMVGLVGLEPIHANFISTAIVIIAGYFGHKFFSFRSYSHDFVCGGELQ